MALSSLFKGLLLSQGYAATPRALARIAPDALPPGAGSAPPARPAAATAPPAPAAAADRGRQPA